MNEGVKILIDRMKSNPEDFGERDFDASTGRITKGKFSGVADKLKKRLAGQEVGWDMMNVLSTEEIEALTAAYVGMERKRFTESVMAKLLEEEPEQEQKYGFMAQAVQPAMTLNASGSLGIGTSSPSANAVTIAPYANGPTIDFNARNINTLNEMIKKWRGEDDGTI